MLGPFEISELIGEGGMGKVWKGQHHLSGETVALKVLLGQFTTQRKYMESFHREVRATARLDHPGIVQVFDYGFVGNNTHQQHPDLRAGAPWLAMEYAPGSSLEKMPNTMSWAELKHLFVQILDALAHSHARNLVHRDLKPANVLRRPKEAPGDNDDWMLTDFGIAHVRDPKISENTGDIQALTAGTPLFMAPEQLNGDWRDYGPWTDLYALGCMAYLLTSGVPPFEGDSVLAIAMQHLTAPVPALKPVVAVPPGFENWLRRLLTKDIRHRCRHAADAASDLLLLGDPDIGDEPGDSSTKQSNFTTATAATLIASPKTLTHSNNSTQLLDNKTLRDTLANDRYAHPHSSIPSSSPPRSARVITPPTSWRRDDLQKRFRTIASAGKGIFGLRQVPVVGRVKERDHLWKEFHQASTEKNARCVIIEGPVGMGKTRLIDWLALRADELGVATVLRATHSPIMNATEGLPRMFQSHLTATDLDRHALLLRLRHAYRTHFNDDAPDELELAALVEWMSPRTQETPPDDIPVVQMESPLERYTLAQTLLRRIARERPVILAIEDGHWGQDSLAFARHLLASLNTNFPILIVVSLRPNALANRLAEREYLQLLTEENDTSTLSLDPLTSEEQHRLIGLTLGLETSLVQRISENTDGTPLFALQLLEDWVSRDLLMESKEGYILPEDEEFPADIHELMERRIDEIANDWHDPEEIRTTMEMAAALGIDVDRDEWERLGQALGCHVTQALEDHLMLHGLAIPRTHSEGWRFRLPLYRDSLEAISRQYHRWAKINDACAQIIDTATENGSCLAERRARYLLSAQAPDEAIFYLWRAVENRSEQSAYIQAIALLSLLSQAFDELGYSNDHSERARLILRHSEALRFRGDIDTAQRMIDEVFHWPTPLPDPILANAHRVLANTENFLGNISSSLSHYQSALPIFEKLKDHRGVARTRHGIGWLLIITGDVKGGAESFQKGYDIAMDAGETLAAAWCLQGVTELSMFSQEPEALSNTQRALELFEITGCRSGMAISHRSLGDHARYEGDIAFARDHYERARYFAESTGHVLASVSSALFALCDITEGKIDDALRRFHQLKTLSKDKIFPIYLPVVALGNLVIATHNDQSELFDELLENLRTTLPPVTPIARDIVLLLTHAANVRETRGDFKRAQAARELANTY